MAPPTLIDTLPVFISPEEHGNIVSATPTSFNEISPVLRHKEDNVSVTFDPPLAGLSSNDYASGALYIIERYVCSPVKFTAITTTKCEDCIYSALVFMSSTGHGFSVDYPSITLHAISRAESGSSLYCQLDESTDIDNANATPNDEMDTEMRELIIVPQNKDNRE